MPIMRWMCDVASIAVRRDVRIVASRGGAGPDIGGGENAGCEKGDSYARALLNIASIPLSKKGTGILNTIYKRPMIFTNTMK